LRKFGDEYNTHLRAKILREGIGRYLCISDKRPPMRGTKKCWGRSRVIEIFPDNWKQLAFLSPECECMDFNTCIEKLDLELPVGDRPGLPYQLV